MDKSTKIAIAAVLVAIAAVSLYFGFGRMTSGPQPPKEIANIKMSKIDSETGKVLELTVNEWRSLGQQGGYYKNPDTKKFTMCPIVTCAKCGGQAPGAPIPPPGEDKKPLAVTRKCPKCGEALDLSGLTPRR